MHCTLTQFAGPSRVISTITQTLLYTITPAPSATASAGNGTVGNSTITAGNSTVTGNGTSTSTTPLTTAPTSIDGGGSGGPNGGAPVPGATGGGGGSVYGPDDGYIAAAMALQRNMILVGLVGCAVGGGLVVL